MTVGMWSAIGAHAALRAREVDPWRSRLVAEVLYRAQPDIHRMAPNSAEEPTASLAEVLERAAHIAKLVTAETGRVVTVKAIGVTDHGEAWASFLDKERHRVTTVCVSEDAAVLRALAAWVS